jgi:hypothetical protein
MNNGSILDLRVRQANPLALVNLGLKCQRHAKDQQGDGGIRLTDCIECHE